MSHSRTVVATFLAAMSRFATTLTRLLPSGQAALVHSLLELLDRHAQPGDPPPLDATRVENTPFGFPIRRNRACSVALKSNNWSPR